MDIEDIRKNYRNFDDDKIESLAKSDAKKLRPEVVPILIEEIKRRNLSENLIASIEVQLKKVSKEELDKYNLLIQTQACPECQSKTKKLNAIILTEVISMILLTRTTKHFKIACPDCLTVFRKKSDNKTLLLGWWGIPWGIIKTLGALRINSKMAKIIDLEEPNDIFKAFIIENIGKIESSKEDKKSLNSILNNANHA